MLLTVGDVTVDLFLALPRLPDPGGDVHGSQMRLRAGGSAANTAAVAAALGWSAGLIGAVGADPLGEWALRELAAAGVEISSLQRRPEAPTSLIAILVTPDGERTMISYRGASRLAALNPTAWESLDRAMAFHLSGYALLDEGPLFHTATALLHEAQRRGRLCALDPGLPACRMAPEAVRAAARQVDVLLLTEAEAALLFASDPHQALREEGPRWVVVKQGARGCQVLGRMGEALQAPAFPVAAMDTTGAGDAFAAGFLMAMAQGTSPAAAALLGNAAGALACTVWGIIGAFPGRSAARGLLARARSSPDWRPWGDALEEALGLLGSEPPDISTARGPWMRPRPRS